MLIDADLSALRGLLQVRSANIASKSIASVSSPVRNLEEWSAMIDHESFIDAVTKAFCNEHGVATGSVVRAVKEEELLGMPDVQANAQDLQSWEWQYGQTPEFTWKASKLLTNGMLTVQITSKRGLVTECRFETDSCNRNESANLRKLSLAMQGDRFGTFEASGELGKESKQVKEVVEWLREAAQGS